MLLCFVFRCSSGNIVTIISYHGRLARWITPFWQPAYSLHLYIYIHVYFSWQINSVAVVVAAAAAAAH